jgi:hypothetical protein
MTQVNYGVVKQEDGWAIIGDNLKVTGYARRSTAILAARRLAAKSGGLPVQLHIQDETGELLPPSDATPKD